MDTDDDPPGRHYIEIETQGRLYWGYTSVPKPADVCCVASQHSQPELALLGTAFHEAGHAVAAHHAGMPATAVEISIQPSCGRCGARRTHGRNIGMQLDVAATADQLLVLAAGVQAELLWAAEQGCADDATRWAIEVGGLDDQHLARDIASSVLIVWDALDYGPPGPDPRPWNWPHQEWRARTGATAWWPQIQALAVRLHQELRLEAADVRDLLDSVPVGSHGDIAAYGIGGARYVPPPALPANPAPRKEAAP